ncbi:hypothetical protein PSPO01_06594 [Paraphaeosphaeria sporulosa]
MWSMRQQRKGAHRPETRRSAWCGQSVEADVARAPASYRETLQVLGAGARRARLPRRPRRVPQPTVRELVLWGTGHRVHVVEQALCVSVDMASGMAGRRRPWHIDVDDSEHVRGAGMQSAADMRTTATLWSQHGRKALLYGCGFEGDSGGSDCAYKGPPSTARFIWALNCNDPPPLHSSFAEHVTLGPQFLLHRFQRARAAPEGPRRYCASTPDSRSTPPGLIYPHLYFSRLPALLPFDRQPQRAVLSYLAFVCAHRSVLRRLSPSRRAGNFCAATLNPQ